AVRGVTVLAQLHLVAHRGRPDEHDFGRTAQDLVETGRLVPVVAHDGYALALDGGEELQLRARAYLEHLVEEERSLDAALGDLLRRRAAGHVTAQTIDPAAAPLGGLVPPVAVERLAPLEVHAVDVARPAVPTARPRVPD